MIQNVTEEGKTDPTANFRKAIKAIQVMNWITKGELNEMDVKKGLLEWQLLSLHIKHKG